MTGIDEKVKSDVSMRGVVSITSNKKLASYINGNLYVVINSGRRRSLGEEEEEEEEGSFRMAA